MPYRSDSPFRLTVINHSESMPQSYDNGNVLLFHFSTIGKNRKSLCVQSFEDMFLPFLSCLRDESVICYLVDSVSAFDLISLLQEKLQYRLWIAIERSRPLPRRGQLPDNHIALVVFTKHFKSFKHTRIQIKYTICPSCGKTTKDYGGKKHLYSPFGTLMSDVWRDSKYCENEYPGEIVDRLAHLFAVEPYHEFHYYDLREESEKLFKSKRIFPPLHLESLPKAKIPSQLLNDDAITAMNKFPDNSIDFAFADPPYNISKKYDNWNDDIQIEEYFEWCDKWIEGIYRILKPGRTFAIINIPLWIVRHFSFAAKIFQFQDLIVWEALGLPVRNIMPAHYGILCLSKGKPTAISNYVKNPPGLDLSNSNLTIKEWYCLRSSCVKKRNSSGVVDREPITNLWWDIHRLKHNSKRVDHPCQLPPDLMKRLIFTFTNENEIVLDPFNGAGTTTLVADLMGRRFIGIEISEKYHNIALIRHQEIVNGINPFRKQNNTPKEKNSRVQRLRKQNYIVSKKTLQLEVREIALRLGRRPEKDDLIKYSKYPIDYFEEYFIDWGEVCAAIGDKGMNEYQNIESPGGDDQLSLFK